MNASHVRIIADAVTWMLRGLWTTQATLAVRPAGAEPKPAADRARAPTGDTVLFKIEININR